LFSNLKDKYSIFSGSTVRNFFILQIWPLEGWNF
jgi:hypothetical protein